MSDFYSNLRDTVAAPLLEQFNQGTITLVRYTAPTPTNPWEVTPIGDATRTDYSLKGAVRGVPAKYVTGDTILESDLMATVSVNAILDPAPELGEDVELDGRTHKIVSFKPIPANGVAVTWQIFLRA